MQFFDYDNTLQKMQLPVNEGEFNFPNQKLYHYAYLSSSIKYWEPTTGVNFLIWETLEYI